MTYGEALAAGYKVWDIKWERGYVSRKCDIMEQPVKVAGGSRKGQLYISTPSWKSSYYCYREYLSKSFKEGIKND